MKLINNKKNTVLLKLFNMGFVLVLVVSLLTPMFFIKAEDEESGAGGVTVQVPIKNPLNSEIDTIPKFIEAVINIVLVVGVPIVVLAVIYTGFLFVSAQGNSEKLTKAKKALLYTLIGAALLLGAFVIANAIQSTIADIKSST